MRKIALTGMEAVWYVLMNICFGAAYLAKVPVKKALVDFGLVPHLTGAEQFWYVMECLGFGAGYFSKVIAAKAISELPQMVEARIAAANQVNPVPSLLEIPQE
jgi:hypothetical protein